MKKVKKRISLTLALVFACYAFVFPSGIAKAETTADNNIPVLESEFTESKINTPAILSNDELAEALTERGVVNQNHTERLYDREDDLNTLVYLNQDGSETAYIFNETVKYLDDSGKVKDKSNILSNNITDTEFTKEYAYVNDRNDINTYFPKTLEKEKGIVLNSSKVSVEMYPNTNKTANVIKQDDSLVVYNNVFGNGIQLQYKTTFEGYKENIVLNDNTVNKFSFIIEADGTYLEKYCEAINVKDSKTKETVAVIDPIYVYDSFEGDVPEGETHYTFANSMEFSKISDGKYEITITVDKEFLSRPSTIYPVYVDPTVTTVDADEGYKKGILDLPIYNGSAVSGISSGANTAGIIGYVDSTYGVGRMLMRFPSLSSKKFMSSSNTIMSARLYLTDVSGQSTPAYVTAFYYGGPSWVEDGLFNSAEWAGAGDRIASGNFSYPDNTQKYINLLSAFKKWKTDTASLKRGIMLKNTTSETSSKYYKGICTSESSSNKPYISVSYFYNGVREAEKDSTPNGENINCQAYAFNVSADVARDFYYYKNAYECKNLKVDEALNKTKAKMELWLNKHFTASNWREVSSYNASLSGNEWLVCMRVGVNNIIGYDYHFWYRANDGKWYNKHGWILDPECIEGVINPSTANSSSGWAYDTYTNFYSSDTIYYAIKAS